ncbi:PAAR domain-containing protein [Pseudoduganella sp. GCM10020061]|uniref:PAAR domain-containing protein n=1 Tax=Pseudoduganella sp. GCM10020061 TaxID=3317345 RepID=UPI0036372A9B
MRRYHITEGAKTTAGGKVIAATSAMTIDGVKGALEGDPLYCPACKSAGKIMCVGPRIPETWNGKPVALSDDLCMCGCPTPPKLLANQNRKYQSTGSTNQVS